MSKTFSVFLARSPIELVTEVTFGKCHAHAQRVMSGVGFTTSALVYGSYILFMGVMSS